MLTSVAMCLMGFRLPPVALQPSMLSLYARLNSQHHHRHASASFHPHVAYDAEASARLVLASIASGPNDVQVGG